MKSNLLIAGLLLFAFASFAQDAKKILKKSYNKCQSVKNGYYEMTRYVKNMTDKDTVKTSFNCYFKKLKGDSLYSSAFHYKEFFKDEDMGDKIYTREKMYTGKDFVSTSHVDSSATIMSKSKWAEQIISYSYNSILYSPFTDKESSPLYHGSDFTDKGNAFKFTREENINGISCYHIQVNEETENDSTEPTKTLRIEYHFWINKEDYIPIQYSISNDMVMNDDTLYEYEKFILNKYQLNHLKVESMLTLNSIPSYSKIKEFVPYENPDLLPIETMAPNWELVSLNEEKTSLKDMNGQLVLIDFFYKECYPCLHSLPALQALSEKYKDKGVKVIGIDPFDQNDAKFKSFLRKRGVTYTVLLGGGDVAKAYLVKGFPTMYLIDKDGKIIFTQAGYGGGTVEELEEIIEKNL